jgi:hypothetical protein
MAIFYFQNSNTLIFDAWKQEDLFITYYKINFVLHQIEFLLSLELLIEI